MPTRLTWIEPLDRKHSDLKSESMLLEWQEREFPKHYTFMATGGVKPFRAIKIIYIRLKALKSITTSNEAFAKAVSSNFIATPPWK